MISALIVVGNYLTENEILSEAIPYDFYQLPSIGDTVAVNEKLKPMIERARKDWNMAACSRLNCVRGIAWVKGMPVVKLGVDPSLVVVDMVYGSGTPVGVALRAIPRVGEMVQVDELDLNNNLYVTDIVYSGSFVFACLSKTRESQRVSVDAPLDVNVINPRLEVDIINNYS